MDLPDPRDVAAYDHVFDHEGNLIEQGVLASLKELVEALREWTIRLGSSQAAA